MLALVLADAAENLSTYWLATVPWLLTLATAVKLACIALLLGVFAAGAAAAPPRPVQASPAQTGQ
ncbi:MAG: hypothetical protein M3R45_03910 [Pseudomonadota bacterium]|nr:hypothetical protein [Pseudomonadota bacterium]